MIYLWAEMATVRCQDEMFSRSKSLQGLYLPLQIRCTQNVCETVLGKLRLTKCTQYFQQNSDIHVAQLSKPEEFMLLAFIIPRCSSSKTVCSTRVLELLIWDSPLNPSWAIGTGVLGYRVTLSSSHEWESWIYSLLLNRHLDQNRI